MRNASPKKLTILFAAVLIVIIGIMYSNGTFASLYARDQKPQTILNTVDGYSSKNYDIGIAHRAGAATTISVMDSTDLFASVPWCPGHTEILYLEVTNNEAFPLSCNLKIKAFSSTNQPGSKLSEAFTYAVVDGLKAKCISPNNHPSNWNDFSSSAFVSAPLESAANSVFSISSFAPGETCYYALAVHMNENATSEFMNQQVNLSFDLYTEANYKPGETPAANE